MADTAAPAPAPPRWTEYQPAAELRPADRNAKDHDQGALARSVAQFGFVESVVVDERTGKLLAGHGRAEWAQAHQGRPQPDDWPAGAAWPPEGVVQAEDGTWLLPVTRGVRSRDDQHADAMGIALNRVGERGGWKPDTLAEMLDEIIGTPLADAAGFSADELDDLIAATGGTELPPLPTDADHAPMPDRDAPQAPREVQGIREVGLMMSADLHREYLEHLAKLKRAWSEDAAPAVVLRALREAAERA